MILDAGGTGLRPSHEVVILHCAALLLCRSAVWATIRPRACVRWWWWWWWARERAGAWPLALAGGSPLSASRALSVQRFATPSSSVVDTPGPMRSQIPTEARGRSCACSSRGSQQRSLLLSPTVNACVSSERHGGRRQPKRKRRSPPSCVTRHETTRPGTALNWRAKRSEESPSGAASGVHLYACGFSHDQTSSKRFSRYCAITLSLATSALRHESVVPSHLPGSHLPLPPARRCGFKDFRSSSCVVIWVSTAAGSTSLAIRELKCKIALGRALQRR
ncbi:hypothetical protein K437DRAFT_61382 [Tilletiaria anomala UBC 951]|uniref:Uncharacterized protein n=1 Tax=Tilletiaria anomala (strain ATCC 24038 / CBS 436.72 / UBC 951) TaxID=1037660 RepID=A0A066WIM0_TILAU|nr:uncharacterized protein K437DRAFT_61382 [Tilletiaria anomala UBC 951]KDN50854.1 hypothetical protein K437DRAFT_61382 [Tilletiaria anomala UBC 951]